MSPSEAVKIAYKAMEKAGYDRHAIPRALRIVYLINWIELHVMQGGAYGWLINTGEYGPDTVDAFDAIGAHQCADIVREILSFFPDGKPAAEDQERVRQITAVEDVAEPRWSELGDRLLAWPDDIHALLQRFINEHEADFT
jgi:Domain of unknown function (DUF4375)